MSLEIFDGRGMANVPPPLYFETYSSDVKNMVTLGKKFIGNYLQEITGACLRMSWFECLRITPLEVLYLLNYFLCCVYLG